MVIISLAKPPAKRKKEEDYYSPVKKVVPVRASTGRRRFVYVLFSVINFSLWSVTESHIV